MLSECENCSSTWSPGTEEYDWQTCAACGWQPGDPIDDDDDDDDDEFDFDEEDSDDDDQDNDAGIFSSCVF